MAGEIYADVFRSAICDWSCVWLRCCELHGCHVSGMGNRVLHLLHLESGSVE